MQRRNLWLWGLVVGLVLGLGGCGGGGGAGTAAHDLLSVRAAQGFPNGKFFPVSPVPSSFNQCIWIEFTAPIDPSTLFDPSTPNGVSANLRLLVYYYNKTNPTPADPLARTRLRGFAVWNGRTNLDFKTKTFRATPDFPVTHADLRIDPNVPLTGKGNYLVFVADSDGDPRTIESFLPVELRQQTAWPQMAQITVNATPGLKSVAGRALSPEFTTMFIVGTADKIPPVVDRTNPPIGAQGVPVNSSITITFSEPIDASTVVVAPTGSPVPATNPAVNLHVSAQVIPPGQPTPQLITLDGTVTPTSGQTTQITFTPKAAFPGRTLIVVNIYSAASTLAQTPPPYHPAIADPSGNLLAPNAFTDQGYTFTTGDGPPLANNPIDPEAIHFITASSGLGTVLANPLDRAATGVEDVIQEVNAKGALSLAFPGGLIDGVVGDFVARMAGTASATRPATINNPPRQCQYWLQGLTQRGNPPTTNVVPPGKYTPPGVSDRDTCTPVVPNPGPLNPPPPVPPNYCPEYQPGVGPPNIKPATPLGLYLFVTNDAKNVVHVINSHTFQKVKDIPTPDPYGLGISPDFRFLFVSNFGANSLSVIDIQAGKDGLPKGDLVRVIPVGRGPQGVAVQPQNEDVFVCNRLDKTVSVITMSQLGSPGSPIRVTMQAGDPVDVHAGPRVPAVGPYYAFVASPTTGEVAIFESGPQQLNGFGRDQVIGVIDQLQRPTGIHGDQWFNISSQQNPVPPNDSITGCFVTLNGAGKVVHIKATRFTIFPLPNPPPQFTEARFEVTAEILVGENPVDVCLDNNIIYCATPDGKQWPYVLTNPPVTIVPSRIYVTHGDGTIGVYEIRTGRRVANLKADGARRIFNYYSQ